MTLDVVYLSWNRLEFTRLTLEMLARNTNWSLVRNLVLYDDVSTDGTRELIVDQIPLLRERVAPAEVVFMPHGLESPVAVMNSYLRDFHADVFAKVDNDLMVPRAWLDVMVAVMEANADLELLGMEAGWNGLTAPLPYSFVESTHIGGVGLMRSSAFGGKMLPVNGRFGFTEWQHSQMPKRGFVNPDILCCTLDRVPVEPFIGLSERYVEEGWQREWGRLDPSRPDYWDWFT